MERERMCSTFLLHRLEEGAEGELSAPAVGAAQSGSFSDLSFPAPFQSLFILNERSVDQQRSRNALLVQGDRTRFLTPSAAPCGPRVEPQHSFMICGRVATLIRISCQSNCEQTHTHTHSIKQRRHLFHSGGHSSSL